MRRLNPIPNRTTRVLLPLVTRFAMRVRFRTIESLRRRPEDLGRAG